MRYENGTLPIDSYAAKVSWSLVELTFKEVAECHNSVVMDIEEDSYYGVVIRT